MAVNLSTGFRSRIIGPNSFESIFLNGCINVYTGAQPDHANMAATGTLVGRITASGGDWAAGSPSNGRRFTRNGIYVRNDASQDWILRGLATGEAGWGRLVGNAADGGGYSALLPRIDFAIGLDDPDLVADVQLRLPGTNLSATSSSPISAWWWLLPPIE